MNPIKAIALLSGGLDSTLAVRLVLDQGIEVIAINFVTPFCTCTAKGKNCASCHTAASQLGVELVRKSLVEEYFKIIEHPKFGYGRGINPCIDCRILKLKKAAELMKERGAQFLITGEVVGQRPMSQKLLTLLKIEKEAGLEGLVLRPLSAKVLPETIPEKKGWVDRSKLLGITGRSRKPQIQLAEEKNIVDYPCPAGGCMLTQPEFAVKVRDLIEHHIPLNSNDIALIKIGRHFRISKHAKLVVGKNDSENKTILSLVKTDDLLILTDNVPGPAGLLRGKFGSEEIQKALKLIAYYVHKTDSKEVPFVLKYNDRDKQEKALATAFEREILESYRIK